MQSKFTFDVHADADTLEKYVLGALPDSVGESLEEHLLICPTCQASLTEIDEYVSLMRLAMARLALERPGSGRRPELGWAVASWGRIGIGVAVLGALLGWMALRPAKPPAEAKSVQLVALRGDEMASITNSRGGPVDLVIDVSDLPGVSAFHLEVVNSAGRQQWTGSAMPSAGKLTARVPETLGRGTYWVRLSAEGGELLREFGLRAD